MSAGSTNLSIDQIKALCTDSSFERGKRYLKEGRVEIQEATPTRIKALVHGTDDYDVEVDLRTGISADCNCPYDWGGYCKHIVAALLYVLQGGEELEDLMEAGAAEEKAIESMLERADPEELRRFLRLEMEALSPLRSHFLAYFSKGGEGKKSLPEYRKQIGRLFRGVETYEDYDSYEQEVDFSTLEDLARLYAVKEDYLEAAKVYQALFEGIEERMENFGESSVYYEDKFTYYLDQYVACIKDAKLSAKARQSRIKYLFDKYIKDPDFLQAAYLDSLEKLCVLKDDMEYWLGLLEPYILKETGGQKAGHENYRAMEYITTELHLLRALGRNEDYYQLIKQYYKYDSDLCLSYAKALKEDGEVEQSVKVAEEGLSLFPDYQSISLRGFLSETYKQSNAKKYNENLLWIFLYTNDWKHYHALKVSSSPEEWNGFFARIIDQLSQNRLNADRLIDVYLREGMYDQAFKKISELRSLSCLSKHHEDLADRYPKESFQLYRELIHSFAGKKTERRHYQEVVSYLRKMREIKGFEGEFAELLEQLKQENRRKPAFIDELKVF